MVRKSTRTSYYSQTTSKSIDWKAIQFYLWEQ